MDKIEKIKAEIERLMKDNHTGTQEWIDAKECAYKSVLSFIDSLQDEPKCIYGRSIEERQRFCKFCSAACDARLDELNTEETELNSLAFLEQLGYTCIPPEAEKNRLNACDKMTKEEYDRESDFAYGIISKEHRTPTFSDAIEYGMKLQKEQMMKEYVDIGRASVIEGEEGNEIFFDDFKKIVGDTFNVGDRLEIKAIKHIDKWIQQN